MGKLFKIFGIFFFLLGISVIFNTFQGMTGFVVYENVSLNAGVIIGIWFVITGILLIVYRKNLSSKEIRNDKRK